MKRKSIYFTLGAAVLFLQLSACVSTPNVNELSRAANTVAFVENGAVPLRFSTGVIDVSSFWSTYGDGVSTHLGGSLLVDGIKNDSEKEVINALTKNQKLVRQLYGQSDFAKDVHGKMLSKLASAFDRQVSPENHYRVDEPIIFEIEKGHILNMGPDIDADLVFVSEMFGFNLTERFSMGGALLSGVTMGTNTKHLTFETPIMLYVLTKTNTKGVYKVDWRGGCGANYVTMKTAFTMDVLLEKPENVQKLLGEAKVQTLEGCGQLIDKLAEST